MSVRFIKLIVLVIVLLLLSVAGTTAFSIQQDYDHEAIQYEKGAVSDAIWRLQQQPDSDKTKLAYDEQFGWLPSVLRALSIPTDSQILNFGKTSFQAPLISPRRPRALYFNDGVSVGYVRGGDVLEIASVDQKQGVIFYTLDQGRSTRPRFQRRDTCLQCHLNNSTLNVPGLMIRSIFPEPSGMPLFHAGGFVTDYRSPLKERWGGWYVTGTHGAQEHMGNAFVRDPQHPTNLDTHESQNLTSLKGRFNAEEFLSPHSDIVALMVIEHQTRTTNLITRAGWETRKALHHLETMTQALGELSPDTAASTERRIRSASEPLLEALLFADETILIAPIRGTSGFAESFARRGPFDSQGRSLRQFDLQKRMFRYPCSFLIYSEAFDNLPSEAREYLYRRLWDVLNGKDTSPAFARLNAEDRKAIREILLATKPNLPKYWR
ncbi:MAG: hypothetical protein M3X11_07350 [Acidobacteriota bacterium]|nr:hypothetical protein [Acidobacteriota bacterium]